MKIVFVYVFSILSVVCFAQENNKSGTINVAKETPIPIEVDSIFTGDTTYTLVMSVYYPSNSNPRTRVNVETFIARIPAQFKKPCFVLPLIITIDAFFIKREW